MNRVMGYPILQFTKKHYRSLKNLRLEIASAYGIQSFPRRPTTIFANHIAFEDIGNLPAQIFPAPVTTLLAQMSVVAVGAAHSVVVRLEEFGTTLAGYESVLLPTTIGM